MDVYAKESYLEVFNGSQYATPWKKHPIFTIFSDKKNWVKEGLSLGLSPEPRILPDDSLP